jgi:hypothetical protein
MRLNSFFIDQQTLTVRFLGFSTFMEAAWCSLELTVPATCAGEKN